MKKILTGFLVLCLLSLNPAFSFTIQNFIKLDSISEVIVKNRKKTIEKLRVQERHTGNDTNLKSDIETQIKCLKKEIVYTTSNRTLYTNQNNITLDEALEYTNYVKDKYKEDTRIKSGFDTVMKLAVIGLSGVGTSLGMAKGTAEAMAIMGATGAGIVAAGKLMKLNKRQLIVIHSLYAIQCAEKISLQYDFHRTYNDNDDKNNRSIDNCTPKDGMILCKTKSNMTICKKELTEKQKEKKKDYENFTENLEKLATAIKDPTYNRLVAELGQLTTEQNIARQNFEKTLQQAQNSSIAYLIQDAPKQDKYGKYAIALHYNLLETSFSDYKDQILSEANKVNKETISALQQADSLKTQTQEVYQKSLNLQLKIENAGRNLYQTVEEIHKKTGYVMTSMVPDYDEIFVELGRVKNNISEITGNPKFLNKLIENRFVSATPNQNGDKKETKNTGGTSNKQEEENPPKTEQKEQQVQLFEITLPTYVLKGYIKKDATIASGSTNIKLNDNQKKTNNNKISQKVENIDTLIMESIKRLDEKNKAINNKINEINNAAQEINDPLLEVFNFLDKYFPGDSSDDLNNCINEMETRNKTLLGIIQEEAKKKEAENKPSETEQKDDKTQNTDEKKQTNCNK